MSNLSEEEIMKILKDTISLFNNDTYCFTHSNDERTEAIQGLLDLYNKEKEKNKELEEEIKQYKLLNANIDKANKIIEENKRQSIAIIEYQDLLENSISKDKIIEKINEINSKMAEQLYIIKEFGEHEGNRKKITMYKEQRDILGELLGE